MSRGCLQCFSQVTQVQQRSCVSRLPRLPQLPQLIILDAYGKDALSIDERVMHPALAASMHTFLANRPKKHLHVALQLFGQLCPPWLPNNCKIHALWNSWIQRKLPQCSHQLGLGRGLFCKRSVLKKLPLPTSTLYLGIVQSLQSCPISEEALRFVATCSAVSDKTHPVPFRPRHYLAAPCEPLARSYGRQWPQRA